MEVRGTPPSDADIQRLVATQRAVKLAGISITPADLAYKEPLEPEKEKKLQETRKKAAALPLPVRKALRKSMTPTIAELEQTARKMTAKEERTEHPVALTAAASAETTSPANATIALPIVMVGAATPKIGSDQNAAWVIFLSGAASGPITIKYSVCDDTTGHEGGEIIVPTGAQSVTVTKQFSCASASTEPNEVTLFLLKGAGYEIGNPDNVTVSIFPDGTDTLGSS
jgi:hypothetical protein